MPSEGWTFLSSALGPAAACDNMLDMLHQFHNIVADLHGSDPGKGRLVWIPDDAIGVSPPTLRRWRVNVSSASLRAGPATTQDRLAMAKLGDVLVQVGEQSPDWIQTDKGWIMLKQVEAL